MAWRSFHPGVLGMAALLGFLSVPRALADAFEVQAAAVAGQLRPFVQGSSRGAPAVHSVVVLDLGAQPLPSDTVQPAGLPSLGKWMLDKNGKVANWLGDLYKGKHFAEPINVVLRVETSDPAKAKMMLLRATRAAGFRDHFGHSSGYQARIEGGLAQQYPRQATHAFSDGPFLLPNDHGRIFGPVLWQGRQYFIGAFSRENVKIVVIPPKFRHPYASFLKARARFVQRMTSARFLGFVPMDNAIAPDDPERTTGDHDGRAALLSIK